MNLPGEPFAYRPNSKDNSARRPRGHPEPERIHGSNEAQILVKSTGLADTVEATLGVSPDSSLGVLAADPLRELLEHLLEHPAKVSAKQLGQVVFAPTPHPQPDREAYPTIRSR